jgi:hypothetical protein
MAIRVRYGIQVQISDDPTNETHDLGDIDYEVVDDQLNDGGSRKQLLAVGSTNVPLDLCGITNAKFVMLKTKAKDPLNNPVEVRIRINGGTTDIPILPVGNAKEGHFLISAAGITAITATNVGLVDMDVIVAAAGD